MLDATGLFPQGIEFGVFYAPWIPFLPRKEAPKPIKYYFMDFENAQHFLDQETAHVPKPILSYLRYAPEHLHDEPVNPFFLDLYNMGATLQMMLMVRLCGFWLVHGSLTHYSSGLRWRA